MGKHIQLSITDPCHENWNSMSKSEQGRFCASCQKQVVDFTGMSDAQLAAFFKKPIQSLSKDGSVCGRFFQDQLERDVEIPRKRIPWVKYFFQFALPAFLVSMKATAQGNVKLIKRDTITMPEIVLTSVINPPLKEDPENPICKMLRGKVAGPVIIANKPVMNLALAVKSTPQLITEATGEIKGRVIDEKGEPIYGSTIVIKGTNKGTLANEKGEFTIIPEKGWRSVFLVISCVGFEPAEIKVENNSTELNIVLPVRLQIISMGFIVTKKPAKNKASKPIPLLKQKLMDTTFKFFKVFPNPVISGASLHIEWEQIDEGYYLLELLDLLGKKVYSKETWIDTEARVLNIEIPRLAAGNYFLRTSNSKSGKSFSEKILIL